jgi:predicted NBD/HSP70 family sugar kinase
MFRPATLVSAQRSADLQLWRPADGRRANLAAVLQALYDKPNQTRADLARGTGLTKVTISALINELVANQLVTDLGYSDESRPGKPGSRLAIDYTARDIVALDLSASDRLSGGVYSLDGNPLHTTEIELDGATGDDAIEKTYELTDRLLASCTHPVPGIGVGTPGIVDHEGNVIAATSLGWTDLPLQTLLGERFEIPVIVENDANAAALGESSFGDGATNMIRVQIQRGVGAGILIGGALIGGVSNAAGEFGHIRSGQTGEICRCGRRGCLETWVSVPYLLRHIEEKPASREEILADAGAKLGLALVPVAGMLDVTDIVLGGPEELIDGPFIAQAQQVLTSGTETGFRRTAQLRLTTINDQAVLLGSVALVMGATLGVL